jgi:hypothetical protein
MKGNNAAMTTQIRSQSGTLLWLEFNPTFGGEKLQHKGCIGPDSMDEMSELVPFQGINLVLQKCSLRRPQRRH